MHPEDSREPPTGSPLDHHGCTKPPPPLRGSPTPTGAVTTGGVSRLRVCWERRETAPWATGEPQISGAREDEQRLQLGAELLGESAALGGDRIEQRVGGVELGAGAFALFSRGLELGAESF